MHIPLNIKFAEGNNKNNEIHTHMYSNYIVYIQIKTIKNKNGMK